MIPELSYWEGSWVVTSKSTGLAVCEVFKPDRKLLERFNPVKVTIETIGTYLGRINAGILNSK